MAVERDAEPAARGHREPALVLQHLQLRELGTRDAAAAGRLVRQARGATAATRPQARRALSRGPRANGLQFAAPQLVAVVAPAVPRLRSLLASVSAIRAHT